MSNYACARCGATFPELAGNGVTTGYATLRDSGERICYACADAQQRADMLTADKYGVYLSSDGKTLTTWTGGELARVTSETTSRTGFHGTKLTHIRAVGAGAKWYGKGAGRGMCLTIHRAKR
jgi:hypothetical protein